MKALQVKAETVFSIDSHFILFIYTYTLQRDSSRHKDYRYCSDNKCCSLPSLKDISNFRYCSRTENIMKDSIYPKYHLFGLLHLGQMF